MPWSYNEPNSSHNKWEGVSGTWNKVISEMKLNSEVSDDVEITEDKVEQTLDATSFLTDVS